MINLEEKKEKKTKCILLSETWGEEILTAEFN